MQENLSFTIPAPTGGWNARDNIADMQPFDAINMQNMFPTSTNCEPRKGFTEHEAGDGNDIETLVEYSQKDGTRQLLGARNGAIVDFTTGGAPSNLGTGFTVDQWQTVQINNQIVFVNGTDQPQKYDGSTLGAAAYTGITDDSVLIQVSLYKSRLYLLEKDSTSIWYGGVSAITGAVTEFDVGDILSLGGKVVYAGSTTEGTGDGVQDYFTIISDKGEVLVYTGSYPGGSDWALSGKYETAPTVSGHRIAFNFNNDLLFITIGGLYSVSNLLSSAPKTTLSDKLQKEFNKDAIIQQHLTLWQGIVYEPYSYLIVNKPLLKRQFVMNTKTGAWTEFTGLGAICFAIFNESLYFSDDSGAIQVMGASSDNGSQILAYVKHAYNYLGNIALKKQITMVNPIIDLDNTSTVHLAVDVDFGNNVANPTTLTNITKVGAHTLYGLGRTISLIIQIDSIYSWSYSATFIIFRTGGIL